jgi:hypothetical protein
LAEILSVTRDAVVTLAAAATAIAAWRGVDAWRRQLKGQVEFETARACLRASYRLRDAMALVRSPFMSAGEQASALAEVDPGAAHLDPRGEERAFRGIAAAYDVRWRAVAAAISDLDLARVEAEATWGSKAAECFSDLRARTQELGAAISMYLRHQREPYGVNRPSDFEQNIELLVFGTGTDEFSDNVKSAVDKVEAFMRPKLK